jgi:serine/threonine protein kinase
MSVDIALPSGYALNEYRIESTLGVGGFGLTYLAVDANLDLKVAIKEYLPGDIAQRDDNHSVSVKSSGSRETFTWGRTRFLEESRTLASFRHPNIVRVMRYFEANQTAYMVMEFVAGKPLNEWVLPRRPVSQAIIMSLLMPLLDGLEVVHKGGYLHRDIKPANIFMRDDGWPVLIDFGSARATAGSSEMTAIVTPGYAPLEQYHSQGNQGPWSDIYSLGAVLYWLVTGYKPVESAARARQDPMVPATQAGDCNRYDAELLKAIDWALTPAEESRPSSVARWREALARVAPMHPSEAPTMLPGGYPGKSATAGGATLLPGAQADGAMPQPASLTSLVPPTSLAGAAFDRDTLDAMEADLAPHIGPIAGRVIRAAARKSPTLTHLAELCGAEIDDATARAGFVRKYTLGDKSAPAGPPYAVTAASQPLSRPQPSQATPPPGHSQSEHSRPAPSRPASQPVSATLKFAPEMLDIVEAALARYIGAIARVVLRRAAAKARDETELYMMLADEIEDEEGKKLFMKGAFNAPRRPPAG